MKTLVLNCDFDKNPSTNGAQLMHAHLADLTDAIIKDAFENQIPDESELGSYDCVIITGSRAAVYEGREWIKKLSEVVLAIDRLEIPTLGVCFGSQLIAQSLGGNVENSGKFSEGFARISLNSEGKAHWLFNGFPETFDVYHSHGDVATKLPEGSTILATNENCSQAYAIRNFLCVQFHPEITPDVAAAMAARDGKNMEKIMNSVRNDYKIPLNVLFNFINHCKKFA